MGVQQGDIFRLKFSMSDALNLRGKPVHVLMQEDFEPVLVISKDEINQSSPEVIVVTVTSQFRLVTPH
ncbi:hypothetical protein ACLZHR_18825 [Priestia aryabhattai]|uniref:hypothetical protein n=1 Tax=Priestia aryabhattai TaxID=412384 RepID=UPI003A7F7C65